MSDPSDPDATSAYHPAPPSAAPGSDRRTVAYEPDTAVSDPRGATEAGPGFGLWVRVNGFTNRVTFSPDGRRC